MFAVGLASGWLWQPRFWMQVLEGALIMKFESISNAGIPEVQCRRSDVGVAVGAAVVCRDVSGDRKTTVVALIDRMARVFMGGARERASVVAASLQALHDFHDAPFEWDPTGLIVFFRVRCRRVFQRLL